jgi:hypothetical protein
MADLDLTLAEELCPADDVLGRRRLVLHTAIPNVADKSATTPGDVTRKVLGGSANMTLRHRRSKPMSEHTVRVPAAVGGGERGCAGSLPQDPRRVDHAEFDAGPPIGGVRGLWV